MDIGAIKKPLDVGGLAYVAQTTPRTRPIDSVSTENTGGVADKSVIPSTDGQVRKKPIDVQKVTEMTDAMNKFVQAMNANIRFKIHEKSNELMVQIVDPSNNQVLKEFPSSEFLDTVAAIRDYVGILLDKKI